MRVLVTGATGFVGSHLVPLLHESGHEVITTGRAGAGDYLLDLTDSAAADQLIEHVRPQGVIHLAGIGSVAASWEDPAFTLQTNLMGSVNLLDALRRHTPAARLVSIGSGEEYGTAGGETPPWGEETPCFPRSPYGTSKLAQGQTVLHYVQRFGLHALHVRAFNHLGAGQPEGYVATDLASQIARMERGLLPLELRVGNLAARRDFLDVRDVVAAYVLLLERGAAGRLYNVASGRGTSIQVVLKMLLAATAAPVTVTIDSARMRPAEVPEAVGDPTRLAVETGWRPRHTLEETLAWVLEDWRERSGNSARRTEER